MVGNRFVCWGKGLGMGLSRATYIIIVFKKYF